MNNFQLACKQRTLFPSYNGSILVTDLYSLELTYTKKDVNGNNVFDDKKPSLQWTALAISNALKATSVEDFVGTPTKQNEEYTFMLDIVKEVIADKKADQKAILAEKQRLKGIAAEALLNKEVAKVQGMSEEELKAILAS